MSKPETRLGTRIEVTKDGMRFRPRLITTEQPRKEYQMNYRDYNPVNSCLPAEAYPYLALALAEQEGKPATLWARTRSFFRWLAGCAPILLAAAFLPLADPPQEHLQMRQTISQIDSLVWVQPLPGKRLAAPPTLPRLDGNPYSF